jgi:hypothetical protein
MRRTVEVGRSGPQPTIRLRRMPPCDPPYGDEREQPSRPTASQLPLDWSPAAPSRAESAEFDQARPDQARPDQARPDQARPDQARPDQARSDQTRPDQTRPDPTRTHLAQTDPPQNNLPCPDPSRHDQTRTDLARTDPARTDLARTDPASRCIGPPPSCDNAAKADHRNSWPPSPNDVDAVSAARRDLRPRSRGEEAGRASRREVGMGPADDAARGDFPSKTDSADAPNRDPSDTLQPSAPVSSGANALAGEAWRSATGTLTAAPSAHSKRRPVGVGTSTDAKAAVHRFVRLCVEVLNGYRPAAHLRRLSMPAEAAGIVAQGLAAAQRVASIRKAALAAGRRPPRRPSPAAVVRLRLCEPRPGAVEAAVALVTGDRTWALALRLELHQETWSATALRLI